METVLTVLYVPGDTHGEQESREILEVIRKKGYNAIFVPINWQNTTIVDWVRQLRRVYRRHDPASTILAGHSFGAVIALIVAAKRNPARLWLFSLSARFKEDFPDLPEGFIERMGPQRVAAFRQYRFKELAPKIRCPTLLTIGEQEAKDYPMNDARARAAKASIKNSRLVIARGAGHLVSHRSYQRAISNAI